MARKKKPMSTPEEPGGLGALGAALAARGFASTPGAAEEPVDSKPDPPGAGPFDGERIVVRRERKGRRGKTVTVLDGLTGDLAPIAKSLKKELGCGASVEGQCVVLQGDQVERAVASLERRGASRVRRGS